MVDPYGVIRKAGKGEAGLVGPPTTPLTQPTQPLARGPYSTQTCILEARTMLTKEVFFLLNKKTIFHFPSVRNGFFCEGPTTNMLQNLGD